MDYIRKEVENRERTKVEVGVGWGDEAKKVVDEDDVKPSKAGWTDEWWLEKGMEKLNLDDKPAAAVAADRGSGNNSPNPNANRGRGSSVANRGRGVNGFWSRGGGNSLNNNANSPSGHGRGNSPTTANGLSGAGRGNNLNTANGPSARVRGPSFNANRGRGGGDPVRDNHQAKGWGHGGEPKKEESGRGGGW